MKLSEKEIKFLESIKFIFKPNITPNILKELGPDKIQILYILYNKINGEDKKWKGCFSCFQDVVYNLGVEYFFAKNPHRRR